MINLLQTSIILATIMCFLTLGQSHPLYQFKQEAFMIPHPQKAHRGGQDAFFSNNQLLIVADGVGGWNNYGIDPSKFSRFLCSKGSEIFHQNEDFYRQNLIQVIVQSAKLNEHLGSSTMMVAVLHEDELRTCYIGDSGFAIFRLEGEEYKLHFEYKEQQHSFNFPFQLTRKDYQGDDPYLSICQNFKIQENDIVVVGSDGLFDNVYVSQILDLVNRTWEEDHELFGLKERLAKLAIQRGQDTSFWSPFAQRAKEQNLVYRGGKLDDTTVIISKIRTIPNRIVDKIEENYEENAHSNEDM